MGSGLKPEHWIVAAGAVFAIGLLAAVVMPDTFWNKNNISPISSPINSAVTALGDTAAQALAPADNAPAATRQQQNDSMAGMVPFSKAKTRPFRGNVVRVISLGSDTGWGQLHAWVDDGTGKAREVSVAPDWYLMHMGCIITEQTKVRGTAFTFGNAQPDSQFYAKTIKVNGKTCRLRNDEGFALWSNRLR